MSDDPVFDRTARIWLEDGPGEAPDRVLQAALLAIETTPMERDLRVPRRFPPMVRSTFAGIALVAIVAVGGIAIWRNQSQPSLSAGALTPSASPAPSSSPSAAPSPSPTASASTAPTALALPLANGSLTVGTRYQAGGFSQPLSFVLPSGFPPSGTPAGDPWADGHTLRIWVKDQWAITIHDDVMLAKDLCDARSGLSELPATPEAIGAWLASSTATTLSPPVKLAVDGRTATAWDATFGNRCKGQPIGTEVYMSSGDYHRFYAIPTGSDTILAITWGADTAATDKLVQSMTFP